jgi:solute carrier family 41
VTLLLLGLASSINIALIKTPVPLIIIILLTVAAIGWAIVTRANRRVGHLLLEGWAPLFVAMVISCGTGIVLDLFVSRFEGFALLAAVISGKLPCHSSKQC